MKPPVAAVVVTYNSADCLSECLAAAIRECSEVVVVDNASSDGSAAKARLVPGVRLIANTHNAGFAAACNQGFRAAGAPYVLLLNPDAVLETPLQPLIAALSQPRTGCAAGALTGPDGRPQAGFTVRRFPTPGALAFEALGINRIWPGNPVNRPYRCLDLDLSQAQAVEQPAGALLMVRRDVWERLGGFDERFAPLWFEDVDFLLRAAQAGFQTWYDPQVRARHAGGHSIGGLKTDVRQAYWYSNLLEFAAKHFSPWWIRAVGGAVIAGVVARTIAGWVTGTGGSLRGCAKVVGFAGTYLLSGSVDRDRKG